MNGTEECPRGFKDAVLIAGPTASGKSGLAAAIAERIGGVVVNADSMQVYAVLDILTARPGPAELSRAPHLLYGHVDPAVAYSTGAWLRDVARLDTGGRRPVFVGGTGLYFKALTEGLSAMPDVPAEIRARWRARLAADGAARLHADLAERDPDAAARIRPSDGQRIVRALELNEASGKNLRDLQGRRSPPLIEPASALKLVIDPDRARLHEAIGRRFDRMIDGGALGEVADLARRGLDPRLPAMRAIGVHDLLAASRGDLPLETAVERAKAATRQYARRQATWFRNQMGGDWRRLDDPQTMVNAILSTLTV